MARSVGVIERPVSCLGTPADVSCASEGVVIFVQLRPDSVGRPSVVVVSACHGHARFVRRFLRETWPADAVVSIGVDQADVLLPQLLDAFAVEGMHVLTSAGVA